MTKKVCSGIACSHKKTYKGGHCSVFHCANFAGHCEIDEHGMPLPGSD